MNEILFYLTLGGLIALALVFFVASIHALIRLARLYELMKEAAEEMNEDPYWHRRIERILEDWRSS